jgi:hypothetical protein
MHPRSFLVGCAINKSLHCPPSRRIHFMAVTLAALLSVSCASNGPTEPTSADRGKFVDTWAGTYGCPGGPSTSDTLGISLGAGALDFSIIIHVGSANPDTVSGTLTTPNLIKVPLQAMGGVPGTAQIAYQGALLVYTQGGIGITCGGTAYARVP